MYVYVRVTCVMCMCIGKTGAKHDDVVSFIIVICKKKKKEKPTKYSNSDVRYGECVCRKIAKKLIVFNCQNRKSCLFSGSVST